MSENIYPEVRPRGPNGRIEIDWNIVDRMLEAGCLGTEIAGELNCSTDTLYNRCVQEKGCLFSDYSRQKKYRGDGKLRIKQYSQAIKGDRGMLIWLGKQRLSQRENPLDIQEFNGKLAELLDKLNGLSVSKETEKDSESK